MASRRLGARRRGASFPTGARTYRRGHAGRASARSTCTECRPQMRLCRIQGSREPGSSGRVSTHLLAPLGSSPHLPLHPRPAGPKLFHAGTGAWPLPAGRLRHWRLHLAGSHPACWPPGSAPPSQPGPGAASTGSSPEVPVPSDAPPHALGDLKSNLGKVAEHCPAGYFLLPPASGQTWGAGSDYSMEDASSLLAHRPQCAPGTFSPHPASAESGGPDVQATERLGPPRAEPRR